MFFIKIFYYLCRMVSERLREIIFNRLYKELGHTEIIPYEGSLYFMDRENKEWYLEYSNDYHRTLWWKFNFFNEFFSVFSLEHIEYSKIIGLWVEEVLNSKIGKTDYVYFYPKSAVENVLRYDGELLNCKVEKTYVSHSKFQSTVDEILDCNKKHKHVSSNPYEW